MSKYCKFFDLNTKIYPGDIREGCCGICNNYSTVNSQCEKVAKVIEWTRSVDYGEDKK